MYIKAGRMKKPTRPTRNMADPNAHMIVTTSRVGGYVSSSSGGTGTSFEADSIVAGEVSEILTSSSGLESPSRVFSILVVWSFGGEVWSWEFSKKSARRSALDI